MSKKIQLVKGTFCIKMVLDGGLTSYDVLTEERVVQGALKRWEKVREQMKDRYVGQKAVISLVRRDMSADVEETLRGPEVINGETARPKKFRVTRQEPPEKIRLREQAEEDMKDYPQYTNYWSSPEWRLARATKDIYASHNTLMAFSGDLVLARERPKSERIHDLGDTISFYSWRKKSHMSTYREDVEFLEPVFVQIVRS